MKLEKRIKRVARRYWNKGMGIQYELGIPLWLSCSRSIWHIKAILTRYNEDQDIMSNNKCKTMHQLQVWASAKVLLRWTCPTASSTLRRGSYRDRAHRREILREHRCRGKESRTSSIPFPNTLQAKSWSQELLEGPIANRHRHQSGQASTTLG